MPKKGSYLNIANQKFNMLTAIKPVNQFKNGAWRWECICDCGSLCIVEGAKLRNKFQQSCGCALTNYHKNREKYYGNKHGHFKGYKDISGAYFSRLRKMAEVRDYTFDISIVDIWEVYEKQNGKCALSGIPIHFESSATFRSRTTASVDRIDSSKGYTKDNIQILHKDINLMKNYFPQEYFIDMCKKIINNIS